MEFHILRCPYCGSEGDIQNKGDFWFCPHCGLKFMDDGAKKAYQKLEESIKNNMNGAIDEAIARSKEEEFFNLRSILWEKTHEKYTDSESILDICREIRRIHPEDFITRFYEAANGGSSASLADFLNSADVDENLMFIDLIVEFMIASLTPDCVAATEYLIERAYKNKDLETFEKYTTALEEEAAKINDGVYETMKPRDVFIAYSSRDMDKVMSLTKTLEEGGLSCFVAMRNLRHGRGAVANYSNALKEAMDNCKSLVFVSSKNSRSFACDAFKEELAYVRSSEIAAAPAEYKNNYAKLPARFKKPRIEYRIDNEKTPATDSFMKEFFADLDYCETEEKVAARISEYIMNSGVISSPSTKGTTQSDTVPIDTREAAQIVAGKLIKFKDPTRSITRLSIPSGVKSIEGNAFYRCTSLKEVIIPDTVSTIGDGAFFGCTSLASITIPASIEKIGKDAFGGFAGTIVCERKKPLFGTPKGWDKEWCDSRASVVWGAKNKK